MANFIGYTVSDHIEVTPDQREAIMEVVDKYHFGMEDCDFGDENIFGIWGYDWLGIYLNNEDYEPGAVEFFEEIRPLIPEGQKLIVECIGHEKLRYISAMRIVVEPSGVEYRSLNEPGL